MKSMLKNIIIVCCLMFCVGTSDAKIQGVKQIKKQIETGFIPGSDGKLVPDQSEFVKSFDEKGNLVLETNTRFWAEGNRTMKYRKESFYSSENRLDSCIVYSNDKYSLSLAYKYNSLSQPVEIQEYDFERKPNFLTKYYYDSNGNKSKEEIYTRENQLYNFKVYTYDKKNNLKEETGSEKGVKRYHWTYKYNSKNQLIERNDFSGQEELLRKRKYEYDNDGRLIRENIYKGNSALERVVKVRYEFY
ncbi:MAG: hypothetical protein HYZ34_06805 [Ignavibacteriae bacterium]|nr:hypothetical protein [Ignavibacteriota bacterium]